LVVINRSGKPYRCGNKPVGLVCGRTGHDCKYDLARVEGSPAFFYTDNLAVRRLNAGNRNQVEVGNFRVPKSQLETCEVVLVCTLAFCKKHLVWYIQQRIS